MNTIMKKLKVVLLLIPALYMLGGCSDYLDINDNPNSPTDVETRQLLSAVDVNLAFLMGNDLQRFGGAFMQYYAGTNNQLLNWDQYNVVGSDSDANWGRVYDGILQDLKEIERLAGTGNPLYTGIAKVIRTYTMSIATDIWGDIPYSQATAGLANLKPKFDPQEEIYTSLLQTIDAAISDLGQTAPGLNPAAADLIYGGDAAKWIKAANSLKLKMLLQLRLRNPALATSGIAALITANNFITSNADNFQLKFLTTIDRQHPMYDFAINSRAGDIAISQRFIDSLNQLQDPRIGFYFRNNGQTEGGNPKYVGFNNGGVGTPPTAAVRALLGPYNIGNSGEAPQRFITAAQVQFMLAEYALTLGTAADARAYFSAGIDASMTEVGVAATPTTTYKNARLATYDAAATNERKLGVVMRDKWASQVAMSIESWNDWRRTGYPLLQPATVNSSPDGQIPVRLPYSASELQSNSEAPSQTLVNLKVWWDN
jgi:hypothetical protein